VMKTTETRTLRKMVAKTRFDIIRKQDIRWQCNDQEIGEWITKRRYEWNQHVSKITPERVIRTVRGNPLTGSRNRGWPHETWRNTFWKQEATSLAQTQEEEDEEEGGGGGGEKGEEKGEEKQEKGEEKEGKKGRRRRRRRRSRRRRRKIIILVLLIFFDRIHEDKVSELIMNYKEVFIATR
jgi:hypothetical protein